MKHLILALLLTLCFGAIQADDKLESKPAEAKAPNDKIIPAGQVEWDEVSSPKQTQNPPPNWKIEVFKDKTFSHTHKLNDGSLLSVDLESYILIPASPKLIYFLEPGYNPQKGLNRNMGQAIMQQNQSIERTIDEMKFITEQLENLRKYLEH